MNNFVVLLIKFSNKNFKMFLFFREAENEEELVDMFKPEEEELLRGDERRLLVVSNGVALGRKPDLKVYALEESNGCFSEVKEMESIQSFIGNRFNNAVRKEIDDIDKFKNGIIRPIIETKINERLNEVRFR